MSKKRYLRSNLRSHGSAKSVGHFFVSPHTLRPKNRIYAQTLYPFNSDYDASQTPIPIDVINLGKEKGLIGLDAWPLYTHNQMVQLINQLPQQYCVDYQARVSKN